MSAEAVIALGGTPALAVPVALTPEGRAAEVALRRAAAMLEGAAYGDHQLVADLLEAAQARYAAAHQALHDAACTLELEAEACAKQGEAFDAILAARFQFQHDRALVGALWLSFRLRVATWRPRAA